jgi:hypothetical protein
LLICAHLLQQRQRLPRFGRKGHAAVPIVTELITINSSWMLPETGPRKRCPGAPNQPEQHPSLWGPLGMAAEFIHDAAEPSVNVWTPPNSPWETLKPLVRPPSKIIACKRAWHERTFRSEIGLIRPVLQLDALNADPSPNISAVRSWAELCLCGLMYLLPEGKPGHMVRKAREHDANLTLGIPLFASSAGSLDQR